MAKLETQIGIDDSLRTVIDESGNLTALELSKESVGAKNMVVRKDLDVFGILNGYSKYQMDLRVANYYGSSSSTTYIPLAGYIIDQTSSTNNNEYLSMIAPFNGTIERIMWRSEIAQNGTFRVTCKEATDATEIPGTQKFRITNTINIADDTTYELDTTTGFDAATATNVLVKGNLYNISIDPPSAPFDTNCTVVFKWDVTS